MPERPDPKQHPHPARVGGGSRNGSPLRRPGPRYAELRCRSNFSLLRGASHPEELAQRAAELGYAALAITDRHTLAGVVRMHCAAKVANLPLIIGAEVLPADGAPICLYATDRSAYGRLSRIITAGRLRSGKGACEVQLADIAAHAVGLLAVVPVEGLGDAETAAAAVGRYRAWFGDRLYLSAGVHGGTHDAQHLAAADALSRATHVPWLASNDVHYHEPRRRFLHDVLTCIRLQCSIREAGRQLFANAERYLKPVPTLERLYHDHPQALRRTVEFAQRCRFSLDELRYEYPESLCPPGRSPGDYLAERAWAGAARRYPRGVPAKVRHLVKHELQLIAELAYEPYFLTVWDIVQFARRRQILCQGRGSAANSAVCYCLGITDVDPDRIDVLFERFVSAERNEPPDIDVDFEHERREEVIQYIYNKYGRDRAGIVAEVITYRPRSAIRDVGKVLGLSLDKLTILAKRHDWWQKEALPPGFVEELGLDPADRTLRLLTKLVRELLGFPRHLSQHVGGFVITRGPLCELVPIQNAAMPERTFIEWDKDDIDALGILKIDCLSLGMLTAIRKCIDLINADAADLQSVATPETTGPPLSMATIPPEDPAVYDMVCKADTVGVFQIESRAQMSMLPRLRPRCFYDLVIEVAIVRPGPIQGKMVHPYLRRRNGEEAVSYPSDAIKAVLHKTLGVPLFQEQAMRLAVVAAGFTPGEADQLRRAMGAWRRRGVLDAFRTRLIDGMVTRGLPAEFAERCFEQICGFGEYGFPESHAASFALLVYVSAWLKRYHPAAFCAAVLNAQPMGFYQPAQLVRDARNHGVTVLPVDVNHSGYDCRLERSAARDSAGDSNGGNARRRPRRPGRASDTWGHGGPAVRLGMRLVRGISAGQVERIEQRQQQGSARSVAQLAQQTGAARATLARLAAADAFASMGLSRRAALWDVLALRDEPPLLGELEPAEPKTTLPAAPLADQVLDDYQATGLSLTAHPMSLVRKALHRVGVQPARALRYARTGSAIRVAGLVLVRQRPGTAMGVLFYTLEDETDVANLIVRPRVYERYRAVARGAVAVIAQGQVERQGDVVHVMVSRFEDVARVLGQLPSCSRDFH